MKFEELEKVYENGDYEKFVKNFLEFFKDESDLHRLRLLFRAANRINFKVFDMVSVEDKELKNDVDYLFNRFLFEKNFDEENLRRLFKNIISKERKDLYDDFMIIFLERNGEIFSDEKILDFLLKNKNKSMIQDYAKNLKDNKNPLISFISELILKKDYSLKLKELCKSFPTAEISFELFLQDMEDEKGYLNFLKGLEFKKNIFVIYNNDINRIENFDQSLKIFTLKDKLGRVKRVDAREILLKTSPIEQSDFRVLKYFDPDKGKSMSICDLIVSILKYKNSGLSKEQLKTELSFIYGKEAGNILNKKKKEIENCKEIEVIYEEPVRYILKSSQENDALKFLGTLKDEKSIRDFIFKMLETRKTEKEILNEIVEIVKQKCEKFKNEIIFTITADQSYIESKDFTNFNLFKNPLYKEKLLIKVYQEGNRIDFETCLKDFEKESIENIYNKLDNDGKKMIVEIAEKSVRIGKPLNFLEWYLNYHLDEKLLKFDIDYIIFRSINIANSLSSKKGKTMFVTSVKKLFFQSKNKGLIFYLKDFKRDSAKIIFDEIEKIDFLTEHQKGLVKRDIYEIFPSFLKVDRSDLIYSTKEGIQKKRKEFENIVNTKLPQLSKMIGEAAALGDLSENSEYKFAREQYSFFSSKAEELKRELDKAFPINFNKVGCESVGIGVVVEFEDLTEKTVKSYAILGPFDADPDNGIISYLSPLAQKLLGKKVGDEVEGKKILKISKWREK